MESTITENHYGEAFAAGRLVEIDKCAVCQTRGQLVGHGVYWRKSRDGERAYRLPIRRWFCKACRHTISALPDFLLRFRWYVLGVVSQVLVKRVEAGASWGELQAKAKGAPDVRTMQRWWKAFGGEASRWLGVLEAVLAQQDSGSPWLDPQGEAVRAENVAQALLTIKSVILPSISPFCAAKPME